MLAVVVIVIGAGCAGARKELPAPTAADERLIRARLDRLSRDYEAGDADAVRRCFSINNGDDAAFVAAVGDSAVAHARLRMAEARLWKPLREASVTTQPGLASVDAPWLMPADSSGLFLAARDPGSILLREDGRAVASVAIGCGSWLGLRQADGEWLIDPELSHASPEITRVLRDEGERAAKLAWAIDVRSDEQLMVVLIRALAHRQHVLYGIREDVRREFGLPHRGRWGFLETP
jgi:hypothetical protein